MEGAPWTQVVNLHSVRSVRKAQAPPSARVARHFPVATGEAKIGETCKGTEHTSSLPCQSGGAVNVSQSHFANARVLGTFSHTTCYPISCAQGLASWTGQQGDRVSGGGGAMNASYKPSIASEVHARHKRPHRLALLATSPVATGEAKQEEPRKGSETMHRVNQPNKRAATSLAALFVLSLLTWFFSSGEYHQRR